MKITAAAVVGMAAATQAFVAPAQTRVGGVAARAGSEKQVSVIGSISDAEVRKDKLALSICVAERV